MLVKKYRNIYRFISTNYMIDVDIKQRKLIQLLNKTKVKNTEIEFKKLLSFMLKTLREETTIPFLTSTINHNSYVALLTKQVEPNGIIYEKGEVVNEKSLEKRVEKGEISCGEEISEYLINLPIHEEVPSYYSYLKINEEGLVIDVVNDKEETENYSYEKIAITDVPDLKKTTIRYLEDEKILVKKK